MATRWRKVGKPITPEDLPLGRLERLVFALSAMTAFGGNGTLSGSGKLAKILSSPLVTASPNLRDRQGTLRKRLQQLVFRLGEVKPVRPIFRAEHYHLSVMDGGNIGSRIGGQHREGRRLVALALAPEASDCHER